jgi:hypothetical protein
MYFEADTVWTVCPACPLPIRRRHARSPDVNPVDDGCRLPALTGFPGESDMSMTDVGAIGGAIVVLALIAFILYKRCFKN